MRHLNGTGFGRLAGCRSRLSFVAFYTFLFLCCVTEEPIPSLLAEYLRRPEVVEELEAAAGVEPANRGFADLRLSHLATPPSQKTIREFRAGEQHPNGATRLPPRT